MGVPAGCPRVFVFPICRGKPLSKPAILQEVTQGPLHGMFLLLISRPAFYRWLNFATSWRLCNRRNGLLNVLFQRHVASPTENAAMTKDCTLLRYRNYILTSCEFVDDLQMRISIEFGNHGCALISSRTFCSPPETLLSSPWYPCFCVLALGLDCGQA